MIRRPWHSAIWSIGVFVAVAIDGCSLHASDNAIPVVLHGRGATGGLDWPLTFGVPFPDGALQGHANIRLLDPAGKEVPIQIRTTGTWRSGSTRWVLIDAQPPIPQEKAAYRVEWGPAVMRRAKPAARIAIMESDQSIEVELEDELISKMREIFQQYDFEEYDSEEEELSKIVRSMINYADQEGDLKNIFVRA